MKTQCTSIFTVVLASLLILGSGGFTICKIVCLKNECPTSYNLNAGEDCCENTGEPEISYSISCCRSIDFSFSLDEFNVPVKTNISALESFSSFAFIAPAFPPPSSCIHIPSPDIPPPDLKEHLQYLGTLLL